MKSIFLVFSLFLLIAGCSDEKTNRETKEIDFQDESRYSKVTLFSGLNEPTEFVILPNKKVIVVERRGDVKLFDQEENNIKTIAHIPVYSEQEDGLMGIALDPNFESNNWLYLYYSPEGVEEKQVLSRFTFNGESLDRSSEIVVLEVPTQRKECCHTGGSIEFGPDGLMYLSTGDDTNPFGSEGFAPIDEGYQRSPWDAQKSSGNTNDLRGKILRISVNPDGTYDIPKGNLFPVGTVGTKPEIYVMGCRNPYRISIDHKNNWLFWGEVGPDAANNLEKRGPRGHDEINIAKVAGNFGWPYFVADNQAYVDFDFTTKVSTNTFSADAPKNTSVNNTGLEDLPPAQKALIWYPYAASEEFPQLGKGGRNAMAGPVYYPSQFDLDENALPTYFEGKLFIYDWIRGWIFTVSLNEKGEFLGMEPFMPNTQFNYMIDMQMGPEGALYVLEYGTGWFTKNDDSAIVRIDFNGGNRKPVLKAAADKIKGTSPLTVNFTTEGTYDHDEDKLNFLWEFENIKVKEANPTFTFNEPGVYYPRITVRDEHGEYNTTQLTIEVGNEPPSIELELSGNQSFYWEGESIDYSLKVSDLEDGSIGNGITPTSIVFDINYLAESLDLAVVAQGHQIVSNGERLISENDCQSCHKLKEKSIGPSYQQVALRYGGGDNSVNYLANKIINGGAGNWGEQAMAAHPDLEEADAIEIVNYILSVEEGEKDTRWPLQGTFAFNQANKKDLYGSYVFSAQYEDRGAGDISPISETKRIILRNALQQAEAHDESKGIVTFDFKDEKKWLRDIYHGSYFSFKGIDLSLIDQIILGFLNEDKPTTQSGYVELHEGSPKGRLIAKVNMGGDNYWKKMQINENGIKDLYFVFKNPNDKTENFPSLDWLYFDKEGLSNKILK